VRFFLSQAPAVHPLPAAALPPAGSLLSGEQPRRASEQGLDLKLILIPNFLVPNFDYVILISHYSVQEEEDNKDFSFVFLSSS
jgi:hypothetical protein